MPRVIAVIPARYASVRFPAKMLADRTGRPLVQHVYERAVLAKKIDQVVIATEDERIAAAVRGFGAECIMTSPDHPNGTSRIAEVAQKVVAPVFVNVQGDEPEMEPEMIDLGVDALLNQPDCPMATVATPFAENENPLDPNMVKVVLDQQGRALYFSRSMIPCDRDGTGQVASRPLKHMGLYVYRREFLATYASLSPTPLEQSEKLEQLRVLEHGYDIAVAVADKPTKSQGIDTPEQYEAFVSRWTAAHGSAVG